MSAYLRPDTLTDALALLAGGGGAVLAGGTDLYVQDRAEGRAYVDITAIAELTGIRQDETGLWIGAATTWSAIAEAALPPALAGLVQAARQIGGRQVQNGGTIGGNLCNASPAADGIPPLLTLEAQVQLVSAGGGARLLSLGAFVLGPRRTACRPDEILTAIHLPQGALGGRGLFHKLGARRHLVISIVSLAARISLHEGRIGALALAAGSCGPVARRLTGLEAALRGCRPDEEADRRIAVADMAEIAPIDDLRATAEYRREALRCLVRRALDEVAA